jgi:hypothetical protein
MRVSPQLGTPTTPEIPIQRSLEFVGLQNSQHDHVRNAGICRKVDHRGVDFSKAFAVIPNYSRRYSQRALDYNT